MFLPCLLHRLFMCRVYTNRQNYTNEQEYTLRFRLNNYKITTPSLHCELLLNISFTHYRLQLTSFIFCDPRFVNNIQVYLKYI